MPTSACDTSNHHRARGRRGARLRAVLRVLIAAFGALAMRAAGAGAQTCGGLLADPICVPTATCDRFGDDPAPYDSADVAVVPTCLGGTRLGPVPDRDGTPRYACLYEPAQGASGSWALSRCSRTSRA